MKKLKVNEFATQGIDVPVQLNEEQIKKCLKEINEIGCGLGLIQERIKKNTLDVNMRECILEVMEHHIADLGKIVGYDSLAREKLEEKHAEIRECNGRIRELEEQLGSSKPIDGFQESIKHFADMVCAWWDNTGLGYIFDEFSFTRYGYMRITFKLKVGASIHRRKDNTKKVIQDYINEGWDVLQEKGEDAQLLDTQNNKDRLFGLLQSRFPSIRINDFKVMRSYGGSFYLREVDVIVYELKDIVNFHVDIPEEDDSEEDE